MQVTLIPRGQARGLTWFVPGEDPTLISKQQIFARIVGALGGRAAEEIIFGDAEVTTGASSDLQQVSCIVFRSVHALKCPCAHLSIRILPSKRCGIRSIPSGVACASAGESKRHWNLECCYHCD